LNASVLVLLFRAIAGARAPVRREEVGKQQISLLRESVVFESGDILLGRTEEELGSQFEDRSVFGLPV